MSAHSRGACSRSLSTVDTTAARAGFRVRPLQITEHELRRQPEDDEAHAHEPCVAPGVASPSQSRVAKRGGQGFSGILSVSGRPFTLGNTIFAKGNDFTTDYGKSTLVHETAHVWQHQQRGTAYIVNSIFAQIQHGSGAYDYTAAIPKSPI